MRPGSNPSSVPEDQALRLIEDLVVAYRILAEHAVIDAWGHVSVRSDRDRGRYFLARALAPELVTPADIMEYDLDSNPIDRRDREMVSERYIHGEVYKARPDVDAVVHSHAPSLIPFSVTKVPLRPLFAIAAFVGEGVPNFEIRKVQKGTNLLINTPRLGKALAATLGKKPAALLRGHGVVVVGDDVRRAVGRSIYLDLTAQLQLQAMMLAGPRGAITYLDRQEVKASATLTDFSRAWNLWRTKMLARLRSEGSRAAAE
jgi:ribulose-5-phosphate 4-epimerase/fuculose-1-phosphate aldolase